MTTEIIETQDTAPSVAPQDNSLAPILEKAIFASEVDVDKLAKLMDLHERNQNKIAEDAFNKAMLGLRSELTGVLKNKDNKQTRSKYVDLAALKAAIDPLLSKYGFYDRYEDEYPDSKSVQTTCVIVHAGGFERRNSVRLPIDITGIQGSVNKTGVHGVGSAMTYAQRYALMRAVGARIAEDDDGNAAQQYATPETDFNKELQNAINEISACKQITTMRNCGADEYRRLKGLGAPKSTLDGLTQFVESRKKHFADMEAANA